MDETIADILRVRSAPEETSRALVKAALDNGSTDNCTALVLDVVALPTARSDDVGTAIMRLPLIPVPQVGDTVDSFVLNVLVSDGTYSRLFGAIDDVDGGTVVLKFPKPQVAAVVDLSCGVRARVMGGHAGAQSLAGARDRIAAGAADLPIHRHAALYRRAAGNAYCACAAYRHGGRPQYRDQAGTCGGRVASRRRSFTATSSRTT